MENFKFTIFSIITLGLLAAGGYWAFKTMESGSAHTNKEEIATYKEINEDLEKEISMLKKQITILETENEELASLGEQEEQQVASNITETPKPTTTTPTKPTTTLKYQTLINELQKLVDANVYLKLKSQGPAVGSVQKFLNTYNGTSNKIDNDFGVSTQTRVKSFQKAQGLTADGEVGPGTLKKMISWLKAKG